MIRHTPSSTLFPSTTLSRTRMETCGSPPAVGTPSHPNSPYTRGGLVNCGRTPVTNTRSTDPGLAGLNSEFSKPFSFRTRSEEHTSELQSRQYFVCRLLLEKK